jgi:hypothetical protein
LGALHGGFTSEFSMAAVFIKRWAKLNLCEKKMVERICTGTTGRQFHHWRCPAGIKILLPCFLFLTRKEMGRRQTKDELHGTEAKKERTK